MSPSISIHTTKNSNLDKFDLDNIPFGKVFTDHMFTADYSDGEWHSARIEPFGRLSFHPATLALHYGQSIFEGMKATKLEDGTPVLFRPELHAKRINASAERMCMPAFPEALFLEAVETLVGLEKDWIPTAEGSALYLRPIMFATDEMIGVAASKTYKLLIFALPVGPYYAKPVRLLAQDHYVRAVKGGVGEAKAAGNYAASLLPAQEAKAEGFDQALWLDAKEFKYLQEVGTMNIFVVIDGKVITPATEGAILKGITRKSVIQLLKDQGIEVEQRPISIDEIKEAYAAGTLDEVFGSGTAAVIAHVSAIKHKETLMELDYTQHKIAISVKKQINSIRAGRQEDKFGWLHAVKDPVIA